jgi:hypothetical protein
MTSADHKTHPAALAIAPASAPLLRIEEARRILAECVHVDEVKDIRDKAQAVAAYYRERGVSLEIQNDAAEVRLRAERRLGELLKDMPKAKGSARPGIGRRGECADAEAEHSDAAKLGDIGITHKQSSVWQRIAAIAEEEFEERVAEAKENGLELTTSRMLRGPPPPEMRPPEPEPRNAKNEKDWPVTLTLTLPHSTVPAVRRALEKLGFTGSNNSRKMKLRALKSVA